MGWQTGYVSWSKQTGRQAAGDDIRLGYWALYMGPRLHLKAGMRDECRRQMIEKANKPLPQKNHSGITNNQKLSNLIGVNSSFNFLAQNPKS